METQKADDERDSKAASRGGSAMSPAKDMPAAPAKVDPKKAEVKEALNKLNISDEDVQKNFEQYVKEIKIDPKTDYFMGKSTILNDPLKALRRCVDIVDELKTKKANKPLFDDPEFGPSAKDVYGFSSISFDPPYRGAPNQEDICWLRTSEICPGMEPQFLVDGATSNDVNQGAIGDCWLIGAMSILSSNDAYIRGSFNPDMSKPMEVSKEESNGMMSGVYPPMFHQFRKYGIYVLRFFKNFQWKYVIMDDKLPCYQGSNPPELIFASCTLQNEFWVPLFEKAYAKIHQTYQALFSGDISDGLVDFTGLISEKLVIQDKGGFNKKGLKSPDDLWNKLKRLKASGTLMGCSIVGTGIEHSVMKNGEDTGLVAGHAYSIQAVVEITPSGSKQPVRLVRVRNPWGSKNAKEWTGPWCDDSEEMVMNYEVINQKLKEMDKSEAELIDMNYKKDGNFFMSFEDFIDIYCKLSICHKFPVEYTGVRFSNTWDEKTCGGTPYRGTPEQVTNWKINTQYLLKVTKQTHVFLSLGQQDGRLKATAEEVFPFASCIHPVVIVVLKGNGDGKVEFDGRAMVSMSPIKQFKEVSLELTLEPGSYVIVPSTQDYGQKGGYTLSIYYPGQADLKNLTTGAKPDIIPEEDESYQVQIDKRLSQFLKLKCAATLVK